MYTTDDQRHRGHSGLHQVGSEDDDNTQQYLMMS